MTKALKVTLKAGTTGYGVEQVTDQIRSLSGVFTVLSAYREEEDAPGTRRELFVSYDGSDHVRDDIFGNILVYSVTQLDLKPRPQL